MKLRYELLALTISAILLINCAGIDQGPTQYEDLNKIKSIVSKNPDKINELDEYGSSYLHLSVREGNIEIVEFLISQGADVNIKDSLGVTPLQVAARAGRLEIVEYLLSKGAKVSVKDHTGNTPLHDAVINEHIQIVKILVSHGADINTADSENQTALHDAIKLKSIEISEFLLTKGANVNTKNDQGRSPLHDAANSGNLSLVKELVAKGAGVNIKDKYEGLPLHYAARDGYLAIVKYLISKGSKINDRGAFYLQREVWELTLGCTPLHIAASQGHLDVVKYLIAQGADVSAKNNDGETALVLAMKNENENVADYLAFLERKVQSSMSDLEDNAISERKSVIADEQKIIKSIMAKLDFGRYTALIIGNNNYEHLPPLKTAQNDAKEVAKILKEKYGFKIKMLLDAKRSDILIELNNLRRDLTNQDNLLIYYAGHGWLDKEADEGYWLPVDAKTRLGLQFLYNRQHQGFESKTCISYC
jgi:ankyrin repeat protein